MITAAAQLERQYHEMRWRILSLAADFDRLDRLGGSLDVTDEARLMKLRRCIDEVLSQQTGRAQRVQTILSDVSPRGVALT